MFWRRGRVSGPVGPAQAPSLLRLRREGALRNGRTTVSQMQDSERHLAGARDRVRLYRSLKGTLSAAIDTPPSRERTSAIRRSSASGIGVIMSQPVAIA